MPGAKRNATVPRGEISAENGVGSRALRITGLFKEYVKDRPVLRNINLEVRGKGITAIIGPSGTGKSTLLRCINCLVEPTAGKIEFDGEVITGLGRAGLRRARRKIGMVFQEYNLVERLTVIENLLCGRLGYIPPLRAWLRRFPEEDITRAFQLLDAVGLENFAYQRADNLSGGQRQRVGIARAMMQAPHILLADEPTSSLDPKTSVEIMELMAHLAGERGIPVIVNIHDVELGKRFADRMVGMSEGAIMYDGPPGGLSDDHLKTIYGGEDWLA